MKIGSKYEEKLFDLIRKLQTGKVSVLEAETEGELCYFCRKQIEGDAVRIVEHKQISDSLYPVHRTCYEILVKSAEVKFKQY